MDMPPPRRWPALEVHELDSSQRRLWDLIASGVRQVPSVDSDGHLLGPYDVLLRAPELGERVAALGVHLRGTGLAPKLRVLAILVVAAHWRSEFEWWAWAPVARQHGLDEEVLSALSDHETPSSMGVAERLVYELASQLIEQGTLDQAMFDQAEAGLGNGEVVELIVLVGYYSLIAWLLNTFQIPLPAGTSYVWAH